MFQPVSSIYSQSTQHNEYFNTNFSYFDDNVTPMADLSPQFYGSGATPFNSSADADLCGLSAFSNVDVDIDHYDMAVPNNGYPAPPAAIPQSVITPKSVSYCSISPKVEFPDFDSDDSRLDTFSPPDAYTQQYDMIQNVNVNFELNEATINSCANVIHHDVNVEEHTIDSTAIVTHHDVNVE